MPKIHINCVPLKALSRAQWDAWAQIQRAHPELESPHFDPRYAQGLAAHRERLEAAIFTERGRIVGFLPFCRNTRNAAEPVASSFSELQGLIAPSDLKFEPTALLRACGLTRLIFTELLACQTTLQDFHSVLGDCPFLDLSRGFEAYRQERREAGSNELQQAMRKARKVEREVAPWRFEASSRDITALETLLNWKQQQLKARKLVNPFAVPWPKQLMTALLNEEHDDFGGRLSLLFIGDELSAASLGIRSGSVLNCWVTAYHTKYQKFSPGLILLSEMARAAQSQGITRIDLGRGDEAYKKSFASGNIRVAQGTIERTRFAHLLRNAGFQAREWVRTTPLGQPARRVVQRCRYALAQWKTAQGDSV